MRDLYYLESNAKKVYLGRVGDAVDNCTDKNGNPLVVGRIYSVLRGQYKTYCIGCNRGLFGFLGNDIIFKNGVIQNTVAGRWYPFETEKGFAIPIKGKFLYGDKATVFEVVLSNT